MSVLNKANGKGATKQVKKNTAQQQMQKITVLFWIILDSISSFQFNSFTKGICGRSPCSWSDFGSKRKFWNNAKVEGETAHS